MGIEIERKFTVLNDSWRSLVSSSTIYTQAYIARTLGHAAIRIRIINDTHAVITVKGPRKQLSRLEYEYAIPVTDAQEMLRTLAVGTPVTKRRTKITYQGVIWEIDEYLGVHQGLVLAEVELAHESQRFAKPSWIGEDVTGDPRYGNAALERNNIEDKTKN